jgi:hypothetical protein
MNKYTFTKTFTFDDSDIFDIINTAVYDIGYWSCIDNDTEVWHEADRELKGEDACFEDVFFHILKTGKAVQLIDVEDDEEVWDLTLDKLLHGIQMALEQNHWDGDIDSLDGEVGDIIFQMALFDEIVFG